MNANKIITIGRQFGSGGREIGKKLAELLNVGFYDKELIELAAKQSGMSEEVFSQNDEKATNSLLYSLSVGSYMMGNRISSYGEMPLENRLFLIQSDVIKELADKGPCVIVGRCADYILRDRANSFSVFIHADDESRISRIEKLYNLPAKKAKELMIRTDKKRANYYNYYSDRKWDRADNYDLCINSSKIGIDGAVQIIAKFAEEA
ncbi:cytidylate kinase family protein [Candidatus Soleaferrea massiliensis]|uniref:cytidylate kinase family protein n=1 Tax=Candidatus Soleaferrea massiliensis TaxID=1470354 RepID=UPI00058B49F8|nr:cytidylate kinase-like family protein [Candidatus Soleaferrea massiliensis]